jgi:hypothetical protein
LPIGWIRLPDRGAIRAHDAGDTAQRRSASTSHRWEIEWHIFADIAAARRIFDHDVIQKAKS